MEDDLTVDKQNALQKTNSSFLYSMGHLTSKNGSQTQSRLKFNKEMASKDKPHNQGATGLQAVASETRSRNRKLQKQRSEQEVNSSSLSREVAEFVD